MPSDLQKIKSLLQESLNNNTFVKLSLGNYKGSDAELKNIRVKRTLIKRKDKLSFTYRFKTRDVVKNYDFEGGIQLMEEQVKMDGFRHLLLCTTDFDLQLMVDKKGKWRLQKQKPTTTTLPSLAHDRPKNRKIEASNQPYLQALRITDASGKVYKAAQNKYRQINHYIEILSSLLKELPQSEQINVVDMGAGKGYLTFALYDYLNNVLKKKAKVTGVEFRKDLVDLCNDIAKKSGFDQLQFEEGTIENYENPSIDVLIALHACDTATDDAIAKGIRGDADLIVVAPCCHKQIRREMEQYKVKNELDFLTQYGIFLERQAEMVTDGIRALILEYFGYSTKVFEFISDAHTPKNVLVVGVKKPHSNVDKEAILKKIEKTKAFFGIGVHHLEKQVLNNQI
ncbi:MAG: SAM-dependent methyltransferase [Chitinophagales bacterium]